MTEVTIRSEHARLTMKILPTVLGLRWPTEPQSEPMTSRLPSVPTTDAKLMTLMYGTVRTGALSSSDVLLPFNEDANSIFFVVVLRTTPDVQLSHRNEQRGYVLPSFFFTYHFFIYLFIYSHT